MAARKLAIEIDKCFKKVAEGVQAFENIYEKIHSTTNPAQKEKLEDSLKKEIKKLQRDRDRIKAWAASNDIKDKKALVDHRKLIETQMEKFKAVEKEMKTKAYSKEGLQAAAKLDPKEQEKAELCDFLAAMVDELERQIEQVEAETEGINASQKKGKKDTSKADRLSELERTTERHKWHQSRLELILRTLENGNIETDQVKAIEEDIKYYVENNGEVDFEENEWMYDDLNLEEEEGLFGMGAEMDRGSSQDAQSLAGDGDPEQRAPSSGKQKAVEPIPAARRPSQQLKSPLPALATLHAPLPTPSNGTSTAGMKPAPVPPRGEPLKYASAAAAAAAGDQNELGIAPLPPAPSRGPTQPMFPPGLSPGPAAAAAAKSTPSPAVSHPQPSAPQVQRISSTESQSVGKSPVDNQSSPAITTKEPSTSRQSTEKPELKPRQNQIGGKKAADVEQSPEAAQPSTPALTNGDTHSESEDEESVYHLPSSLNDLLESFEATKLSAAEPLSTEKSRLLFGASFSQMPESADTERPRHYQPQTPYPYSPSHYPQEPLAIFDDHRLYSRVDTDTLFYAFYYRQGTYQQWLAAKALKNQSWRFHKQYQTWFQRHEEPKSITEDYEQGTYRFFDYESTWMNRRKADFKFHYKWLEDDL
ncbi:CCR4-NOT transcription complex [Venturia nashicola]|nr:CCR4-NOT transcription complex [Venturia nashicola]